MKTKQLTAFLILSVSCLALSIPARSTSAAQAADRSIDLEMIFFFSSKTKIQLYAIDHARADFPDIALQATYLPMNVDRHSESIKRLAKSADGLAVNVIDAQQLNEALTEAARKTTLVTFEYDGLSGVSKTLVGHDEYAHGQLAARLIQRAADGRSPVHVFTQAGHSHPELRIAGMKSGLVDTPIKLTQIHHNGNNAEATGKAVRNLLATTEGPMILVAAWYDGETILDIIRKEGRQREVKLICFERSEAIFDGVEKGDVVGTILQDNHRLVYETVRVLRAHAIGEQPKTTHRGAHSVKGGIVDHHNLDAYLAYQQSILDRKKNIDFFAFELKDDDQDENATERD